MSLRDFTKAIAAITAGMGVILGAEASNSQSIAYRNTVSFVCENTFDRPSGAYLPTTVAKVPRRSNPVKIIRWQLQEKGGFSNQQRCQIVSQKFDRFYNQGQLNYITSGEINGYSVICAVANRSQQCNRSNILFTVVEKQDPNLILQKLTGIMAGKESGNIIYQSSGEEQMYFSVEKMLEQSVSQN